MSERGHFRGGRGGGRGGRGGGGGGGNTAQHQEKPKKENILDLTKYMEKQVTVKFNGGREGKPLGRSYKFPRKLTSPAQWLARSKVMTS